VTAREQPNLAALDALAGFCRGGAIFFGLGAIITTALGYAGVATDWAAIATIDLGCLGFVSMNVYGWRRALRVRERLTQR
jgi:hypothetical protein